MSRRILVCLAAVSMAGIFAGCSTMNLFGWGKEDFPISGPTNPVVQILPLWQQGEGTNSEGKPTRGFIGQIYFFTQDNPTPAVVDGEVRIYVFDDQGTEAEQIKPIHQFDFPAESWKVRMTKAKLGPTYGVFIPYTRQGAHAARCSLRLRFKPRNGPLIYSEMVNVALPGTKSKSASNATANSHRDPPENGQRAKLASKNDTSKTGQPAAETRRRASPSGQSIQDILASMPRSESVPRRTAGIALSEAERERIVRETREKLKAEPTPAVRSPDAAAVTPRPVPRKQRSVAISVDESEAEAEPAVRNEGDDQASTRGGFRWKPEPGDTDGQAKRSLQSATAVGTRAGLSG